MTNDTTKSNGVNEKQRLMTVRTREYPISLKVIKAFPTDKADFKPHERSRSAKELVETLAVEQLINMQALEGTIDFSKLPPHSTSSMEEAISLFEKNHKLADEAIENASEETLNKMVKMGPGEMRAIDAIWAMHMDSVHHRGQFSVYIRMAGGKVPSIYGPSADETLGM